MTGRRICFATTFRIASGKGSPFDLDFSFLRQRMDLNPSRCIRAAVWPRVSVKCGGFRMKRFLFLCLLILPAFARASAEMAYAARTAQVFASPGGTVLGQLFAGSVLEADKEQNGFCRIRVAGLSGFVKADLLSPEREQSSIRTARTYSPYGTETVVLRSVPSDSCSTAGILRAGESVHVLGSFGGFSLVRTANLLGFLSHEELR